MAQQYYSDSDTDSYGSCEDEEYSNVDFGTHSVISFGPPSIYHHLPQLGRRQLHKIEEEESIYELVGEAGDGLFAYGKVLRIPSCKYIE